jgi:hypothetical protein
MATVWFRCDRKNEKMFVLNQRKELNYIPVVGDEIKTCEEDFMKTTFRIKPWSKDAKQKSLKNNTFLDFKVISRQYDLRFNEWKLICEPTAQTLLFLLQRVKTN